MLVLWTGVAQSGLSVAASFAEPAAAWPPQAMQAGERLSTALRTSSLWNPNIATPERMRGLMLRQPSLVQTQSLDKVRIRTALMGSVQPYPQPYLDWLERMPVTGRLVLKATDPDELALNPAWDPVFEPGDTLALAEVSNHIGVLTDQGLCAVQFEPGRLVSDYIRACAGEQAGRVEYAWLVTPDGQVSGRGVAPWNQQPAVAVQPGSWVLAPSGAQRALKAGPFVQYAAYLATQGTFQPQDWVGADIERMGLPERVASMPRDLPVSSNTWGLSGLLQTPTARFKPAGTFGVTASRVEPYSRYSFILHPFDWLEGGFRYTKVTNRLFGPVDFSGDQKYLDKNIDLKVRLLTETAWRPQVAAGLQDLGGTALFAGEYLVASKRYGDWDWSLGLGYGYLGRTQDLTNPLALVSGRFRERSNRSVSIEDTGKVSGRDFFRGRAALFGGVQWHTPWERWVLKLELEGNDYRTEPLDNPQSQSSRINGGLVYQWTDSVRLHVGVERGNTMSVGVSLSENLARLNTPKVSDPAPLPVKPSAPAQTAPWAPTAKAIEQQSGLVVSRIEKAGSEVRVQVDNARLPLHSLPTVERIAEVLHQNVDQNTRWFTVDYVNNGLPVGQHVVDREAFVKGRTQYVEASVQNSSEAVVAMQPQPAPQAVTVHEKTPQFLTNKTSLSYRQVVGGADGYLYQVALANDTSLKLGRNVRFDVRLSYGLFDNFDRFTQGAVSNLPQVRTRQRDYATTSNFTMPNAALKAYTALGQDHFLGAYGGYLEPMFAGVGMEYLYRPHNSPWALSVDVNRVRQRAFEQDFDLLPYTVNTGHMTVYADTGIEDIQAALSVGQYLAGDRGATLDLSREFVNGARMGVFATRTNVSARDFGEGSFDKGIYVTIPFTAFFTRSIPGEAGFLWRPVTRDGGAMLSRGFSLMNETELRNPRTLRRRAQAD